MLGRTSASRGFNGPVVELTDHKSCDVLISFPAEHGCALDRLKEIDKKQEDEKKKEFEASHPGQVYHRVLNQYFCTSYK